MNWLIKEVESTAPKDILEVERFVKWLDRKLASLVDERAVLKHFPRWPEAKADALREAAFSYRDLKSLESEVCMFRDNPKEEMNVVLKRAQALQDRRACTINLLLCDVCFGKLDFIDELLQVFCLKCAG